MNLIKIFVIPTSHISSREICLFFYRLIGSEVCYKEIVKYKVYQYVMRSTVGSNRVPQILVEKIIK